MSIFKRGGYWHIHIEIKGAPAIRESTKLKATTSWYKALKRAGLEGFRWHDLRHTWASNHARSGTPMHVLQKLGGWESAAMVQVYAHLAPEHMSGYAEAIVPNESKIRRVK